MATGTPRQLVAAYTAYADAPELADGTSETPATPTVNAVAASAAFGASLPTGADTVTKGC